MIWVDLARNGRKAPRLRRPSSCGPFYGSVLSCLLLLGFLLFPGSSAFAQSTVYSPAEAASTTDVFPTTLTSGHTLLFRPPGLRDANTNSPASFFITKTTLEGAANALSAAYLPSGSNPQVGPSETDHRRDRLSSIQVMVPDTMSPAEIEEFLNEIYEQLDRNGFSNTKVTPVPIPVKGMLKDGEEAIQELAGDGDPRARWDHIQDEAMLMQSTSERQTLANILRERLRTLKNWADQVRNWDSQTRLEKRNFILLSIGLGRALVVGSFLFMDGGVETANLLRMAFVFALDIYFMVGHKHFANIPLRFNPSMFGQKVKAWLEQRPRQSFPSKPCERRDIQRDRERMFSMF